MLNDYFNWGAFFAIIIPILLCIEIGVGVNLAKAVEKTLFGGRCRWWWWILVPSALSVGVESCCCFAFLPVIALVYNHVFDVRHFILKLNASVIL